MIELQKGDEFVVRTKSPIAPIINWGQKTKALDCESWANHAGLIIGRKGETFESLLRIGRYNIDHYVGCRILIVRHQQMTDELFEQGWAEVRKLEGLIYPFWRLPLHLVGLAKFVHWKFTVCSEVDTKFEFECDLRRAWWGYNPDNLADEWVRSRFYDIKYQEIWNGLGC